MTSADLCFRRTSVLPVLPLRTRLIRAVLYRKLGGTPQQRGRRTAAGVSVHPATYHLQHCPARTPRRCYTLPPRMAALFHQHHIRHASLCSVVLPCFCAIRSTAVNISRLHTGLPTPAHIHLHRWLLPPTSLQRLIATCRRSVYLRTRPQPTSMRTRYSLHSYALLATHSQAAVPVGSFFRVLPPDSAHCYYTFSAILPDVHQHTPHSVCGDVRFRLQLPSACFRDTNHAFVWLPHWVYRCWHWQLVRTDVARHT